MSIYEGLLLFQVVLTIWFIVVFASLISFIILIKEIIVDLMKRK